MKQLLFYFLVSFLFFSCGTHKYFQPTVNSTLFKNQGELHVSGDIGSSGSSIKAAYALPKHIGVVGSYNAINYNYGGNEIELGLGYYTEADPRGIFILGGVGFGSNYEYFDTLRSAKIYEGDFIRPFVQFNGGIAGGSIWGGFKGHIIATLKSSYLMYDGKYLDGSNDKIYSRYAIIEPGFVMGVGSRVFKMDFIVGMPFHPTSKQLNERRNARVYPFTVGIGIRFVLGRAKD